MSRYQLCTFALRLWMTSEARGQRKTPENARWFAGYLRGLRRRLGNVYVDFGEPVPLRRHGAARCPSARAHLQSLVKCDLWCPRHGPRGVLTLLRQANAADVTNER